MFNMCVHNHLQRTISCTIVFLVILLSACENTEEVILSSEPIAFTVIAEQQHFDQYLRTMFENEFPYLDVRLIEPPEILASSDDESEEVQAALQEYLDLIEQEKVGLVAVNQVAYKLLALEDILIDFSMFAGDQVWSDVQPGSVEMISQFSKGSLYGINTHYNSMALFYNKDLFQQYKIAYPEHQMAIQEIMELASDFGSAKRDLFGLFAWYPSSSPADIFEMLQDRHHTYIMVSDERSAIHLDRELWRELLHDFKKAYDDPGLKLQEHFENRNSLFTSFGSDPFSEGRAAMTIQYKSYYNRLKTVAGLNERSSINYGVVSKPVEDPHFFVSTIYSIPNATNSTSVSWDVLSYMLSREYATSLQMDANSLNAVSVRTDIITDENGRALEAFHLSTPSPLNSVDQEHVISVRSPGILNELIQFIQGIQGVDETISEIAQHAENILQDQR